MAGIGGDIFGVDKAVGGGNLQKPTNQDLVAGTFDPNYQVIHINFKGEKTWDFEKFAIIFCTNSEITFEILKILNMSLFANRNLFQTLAAVGGDIFGADKKGESPAPIRIPSAPERKVSKKRIVRFFN